MRKRAAFVLVSLLAVACGRNPVAPTSAVAHATAAASVIPNATGSARQSSSVDLASCLAGSGNPDCFDARALRAAAIGVSPATAPSAPTNLACTVSGGTVALTWAAPTAGDAVVTYRLQAGSGPGLLNLADFRTSSSATNYTALLVGAGAYYVRVLALNSAFQSSPASNEVLVTVGAGAGCTASTPVPTGPLSAPRSLVNAAQSAGTISLAWSAPASGTPTSYVIVAGSAPGQSDLVPGSDTGSTALSLVAANVPPGQYYVRVYAKNSAGLSPPSNEVLVFVIAFGNRGDVQVSLSWDAPSDLDLHVVEPSGEDIYYANSSSSTGGQLDVDSNAACSIDGRQIENVRWIRAPGGSYTVRVDNWDSCGVARSNYTLTVKNGAAVNVFTGTFTDVGDHGGAGDGRTIMTFVHAASVVLSDAIPLFRAPQLFAPSAQKLRIAGQR